MTETRLLPDGLAVVVETKHGGRLYATQDRHGFVILEAGGKEISMPRQSARDLAEGLISLVGRSDDDYWTGRMEVAKKDGGEIQSPEEDDQDHGNLKRRPSDKISLADLVAYGLLPPESRLTCRVDDVSHQAVVTEGGLFRLNDGSTHESPSGAFKAATGRIRNGWEVWQTSDGIALEWFRWHLRARRHAVEFATPNTTLHSRRELMSCWIDRCRDHGMKPDHYDTRMVDNFIAEFCPNHYADPDETREVIIGWFTRCKGWHFQQDPPMGDDDAADLLTAEAASDA